MNINNFFATAVTALILTAPASAKSIYKCHEWRHSGGVKRAHDPQQPAAVQEGWASNRWGLASWRFGDHYFDGI
jgi:hypothetical protein